MDSNLLSITVVFIAVNFLAVSCAPRLVNQNDEDDVYQQIGLTDFVNNNVGVYDSHLRVSEDSFERLANALAEEPSAVYINYEFNQEGLWDPQEDDLYYLNEDEYARYINPLQFLFVLPAPKMGNLLLSLPFDFIPLSFAGLGVQVATVTVNVTDPDTPFNKPGSNDTYELQWMFDLTEDLIRDANPTTQVNLNEFSLCTERLNERRGGYMYVRRLVAAIMNNRYPLFQSEYDCREYIGMDMTETIPEQYWFNYHLPLIFGFLVFCFAPLLLVFFYLRNPPFEDDHGNLRITETSDLPIGFKYTFLFSYNNNEWVRGFKVTLGLFLLVILSYLQPLVAYLVNRGDFSHRRQAAERMDNVGYWVYIGVMLGYYVLFFVMFLSYMFNILLSDQTGIPWESDRDRQRLTFMQLPRELWIQPVDLPLTQSMIYHAKERMLMGLDIRVWKYEFWRLWDWITSGPDCDTQYMCKYTFGILTYILLVVPYGLLFLVRLFFNSLPSFYIMRQCLFDWKCNIPIGAITIIFAAARVPPIIWYIITLAQCTFAGLVTNHQVVLPSLIIAFAILYFGIKTYEAINKDYIEVTKNIVNEVVSAQDKLTNTRPYSRQSSQITKATTITPTLYTLSNGLPAIELDLWHFVINDIRSVRNRFFGSFLTFLLASGVLAIEFQFLWYINMHQPLGPLVFPLAAVLLALTLPLLHRLITPGATFLERKQAEDIFRIRSLVALYFRRNGSYDLKDDFGKFYEIGT